MFVEIVEQWKSEWSDRRQLFFLEIIGVISSITASVLISIFQGSINLMWVFVCWLIGSVSMGIAAYLRNIGWPMLLMIVYTFFNIIGLYNAVVVKGSGIL